MSTRLSTLLSFLVSPVTLRPRGVIPLTIPFLRNIETSLNTYKKRWSKQTLIRFLYSNSHLHGAGVVCASCLFIFQKKITIFQTSSFKTTSPPRFTTFTNFNTKFSPCDHLKKGRKLLRTKERHVMQFSRF
jgi:hypothetical protein